MKVGGSKPSRDANDKRYEQLVPEVQRDGTPPCEGGGCRCKSYLGLRGADNAHSKSRNTSAFFVSLYYMVNRSYISCGYTGIKLRRGLLIRLGCQTFNLATTVRSRSTLLEV